MKWDYLKKIASLLVPYTCLFCSYPSSRGQDLCDGCLNELPLLGNPCIRCAKPLQQNNLICGDCLTHSPPFDRTFALFVYEKPITRFVMQIKFNHALLNARIAGELLTEKIITQWYLNQPLPDLIIPVPLHPLRLRERGFNQAIEIARPLSKKLQLPLDIEGTQRVKATAAQATLLAKDRILNIKEAFQVNRQYSGLHLAVVDDVITTGHTIREFCRVLKKAGARQIDVWSCARAFC
jgi:ComF family protein